MIDQVYTYYEMCGEEGKQTLQRGMNFKLNSKYSVILMSQKTNAPYKDKILSDGRTVIYEGHDEPRVKGIGNPKEIDQPRFTKNGRLTQNGYFAKAVDDYKSGAPVECVKIYEKILNGVWSFKGIFNLINYQYVSDGVRNVFLFQLILNNNPLNIEKNTCDIEHTRLIPSEVKKHVWARDKGKCVLCGSNKNLHFDHDIPYSRGGTSLTVDNIRLLCLKCNLAKSDKIE